MGSEIIFICSYGFRLLPDPDVSSINSVLYWQSFSYMRFLSNPSPSLIHRDRTPIYADLTLSQRAMTVPCNINETIKD